jgi:hypothetical protein
MLACLNTWLFTWKYFDAVYGKISEEGKSLRKGYLVFAYVVFPLVVLLTYIGEAVSGT